MSDLGNKILNSSIYVGLLVSVMIFFAAIWGGLYGKHNVNESVMLSCHSLLVGKTEVQQCIPIPIYSHP